MQQKKLVFNHPTHIPPWTFQYEHLGLGVILPVAQTFENLIYSIKAAEDKHGYKYSLENDQMATVSLQCLTWRRLLIWPTCLSVKAINISDDDNTLGQALWACFWPWSGVQGSSWKMGLPKQVVSKDLKEVPHTFPIVIVVGFLSVRHKEQIKISPNSLWLSDARSKNVSSRKEESHSPTQEHVGSSKANLWWRCGNC